MLEHGQRRARLAEHMAALGIDLVFLPVSADLEYLTGFKRRVVTFGNIEYAHSWVTGCFLAPGREPVFVLPRMVKAFDLPEGLTGEWQHRQRARRRRGHLRPGGQIVRARSKAGRRRPDLGDTTLRLLQSAAGADWSAPTFWST